MGSVCGNLFQALIHLVFQLWNTNDDKALVKGGEYNFEKIGSAVCLIYGFLILFPMAFVAVNRAFGNSVNLTNTICVYGYSFFVYVIAGLLCTIPDNTWRWAVLC